MTQPLTAFGAVIAICVCFDPRLHQSDFAASLTGPLQRNSLCNLLAFTYKVESRGQSFPFCARLLYKDLTITLPTDVTVTYQGKRKDVSVEKLDSML